MLTSAFASKMQSQKGMGKRECAPSLRRLMPIEERLLTLETTHFKVQIGCDDAIGPAIGLRVTVGRCFAGNAWSVQCGPVVKSTVYRGPYKRAALHRVVQKKSLPV